jgi:hypothetical protein
MFGDDRNPSYLQRRIPIAVAEDLYPITLVATSLSTT